MNCFVSNQLSEQISINLSSHYRCRWVLSYRGALGKWAGSLPSLPEVTQSESPQESAVDLSALVTGVSLAEPVPCIPLWDRSAAGKVWRYDEAHRQLAFSKTGIWTIRGADSGSGKALGTDRGSRGKHLLCTGFCRALHDGCDWPWSCTQSPNTVPLLVLFLWLTPD